MGRSKSKTGSIENGTRVRVIGTDTYGKVTDVKDGDEGPLVCLTAEHDGAPLERPLDAVEVVAADA